MGWIQLAEDRDKWWGVVNTNEPSGFIKCGEFLDWLKNFSLCCVKLVSWLLSRHEIADI
jgi:hypothetical protein